MALQTELAEVNIKINKQNAELNLSELNAKVKAVTESLSKMHKADNPQLYEKRLTLLSATIKARDTEKASINGSAAALKQFQKQFIEGMREAKAATTNNPVTKFTADARKSFEALQNTVQKSPLTATLNKIKSQLSTTGNAGQFFQYIVAGFSSASLAVDNHKNKLQLHKEAVAENKAAQEALTLAMAENKAAQEAVTAALVVNKAAQVESAAAVGVATTMEEAQTAAIAHKKLIQEEDILVTQAEILATEEQTIVMEAATVATEANAIATGTASGALGVLRVAIMSTGIGLLIVAFAALVTYFTETTEGAKKFKVIMTQLNGAFQAAMKYIAPIGKALFDVFTEPQGAVKLMTSLFMISLIPIKTLASILWDIAHGNFKQAFKDIGDGVIEFANRSKDAAIAAVNMAKDSIKASKEAAAEIKKVNFIENIKSAGDAMKARQKLTIEERAWTTEKVKQQGEVALLTKKLRDQNITAAERITLAEKAKTLREQIFNKDLAIANKNEELVNKEQAFRSKKDLDAIQAAKTRVEEVKKAYALEDQNIENRESGLQHKAETKAHQAKSAYEKLLLMAKEFNAKDLSAQAAKNDAEIQAEEIKYDKLIDKEKAFLTKKGTTAAQLATIKANIAQQEVDKQAAINAIRLRQEQNLNDKIKKFNEQLTDIRATELQKQTDKINEFYDGLSKAAGDNYEQQITIEAARQTDINNAKLEEEKRLKQEIEDIRDEGARTDEDKQKAKLEKIKQHYQDEIEVLKKKFSTELQLTKEFQDAIEAINGNEAGALKIAESEDPAIKKAEKKAKKVQDIEIKAAEATASIIIGKASENAQREADLKIKSLEAQKTKELSNKNLTEAQKKAIDDKYTKLENAEKLKAWKANQTAKAEEVLINSAVALTKIWVETGGPVNALGLPNPGFFEDVTALGISTAAQEAAVLTAKPPVFADGGIPDGPAHIDGGLNLVDRDGRMHGQIEGGEPVLSKNTYANNKTLVDALLGSGGRRLNIERVQQAVASRENRAFNQTNAAAGTTPQPAANGGASWERMDKMEALMHDFITKQAQINAIPVHFYNTQFELFQARNAVIKNDATV